MGKGQQEAPPVAGVEGRELWEMRGDQSHAGPVGRLVGIVGHGKDGGFYSEGSFGRDLSRRRPVWLTP